MLQCDALGGLKILQVKQNFSFTASPFMVISLTLGGGLYVCASWFGVSENKMNNNYYWYHSHNHLIRKLAKHYQWHCYCKNLHHGGGILEQQVSGVYWLLSKTERWTRVKNGNLCHDKEMEKLNCTYVISFFIGSTHGSTWGSARKWIGPLSGGVEKSALYFFFYKSTIKVWGIHKSAKL